MNNQDLNEPQSGIVTIRENPVVAYINQFSSDVSLEHILPAGIGYQNYIARFANVIRNKNALRQLLLDETKDGVYLKNQLLYSLIFCAAHGLVPDGNEITLIPFRGKNPSIATIICKAGYQKMARRKRVNVDVILVFKDQPCRIFVDEIGAVRADPDLSWIPNEHITVMRDGKPIPWNYEIATLQDYWKNLKLVVAMANDGVRHLRTEVMYVDEIKKCSSVAKTNEFWGGHPKRMIEKTVLRRLCKELQLLDIRDDVVVEREEGIIEIIDQSVQESIKKITNANTKPSSILIPNNFDDLSFITTAEVENEQG